MGIDLGDLGDDSTHAYAARASKVAVKLASGDLEDCIVEVCQLLDSLIQLPIDEVEGAACLRLYPESDSIIQIEKTDQTGVYRYVHCHLEEQPGESLQRVVTDGEWALLDLSGTENLPEAIQFVTNLLDAVAAQKFSW